MEGGSFGASVLASLAIALFVGSAAQTEADVSKIDQPEAPSSAEEAARLERHATLRLPSAPVLRIPRGQTGFIEVEVTLLRPPKGRVDARLTDQKQDRGVAFASWAEVTEPAEKGRTKISVLYAIRVAPATEEGRYEISATLGAFDLAASKAPDRGPNALLGRKSLEHTVEVIGPAFDLAAVELDRRAYAHHQGLAIEAHGKLGSLRDQFALDRVDPAPAPERRSEAEAERVRTFLHHRLRADVALERLRAAASRSPDVEIATAALRALGSSSRRLSGPAARASTIEGKTTAEALASIAALIEALRLDEAEATLGKLRNGGKLSKDELSRTLVMLGGVNAARGRDADARRFFGQALCIDPKLVPAFRHALMLGRFEEARRTPGACARPTSIDGVTAYHAPLDHGVGFLVRASFGPDPEHLVAGGDIELWGTGGGRYKAEKVRADPGTGGRLEARFTDPGGLENYAGDLLVKVLLRDVSGVVVATFGEPDPTPVALGRLEGAGEPLLPLWAWLVLGGVAVAGAVSALVIVRSNRETKQGLGPFSVEF